ncbi:MAG: hypothetical protein K0Q73_6561 [Paenibacillus sp.]|nr:hypothetical protein [Paenibacillus sp.]
MPMIIGLILIIISSYPLFLIIRESVLESYISSRYEVEQVINIRNEGQIGKPIQSSHDLTSPIKWEDNNIEVVTKDSGVEAPEAIFDKESKHVMNITIIINGKEVFSPTEAWLTPNITKDSDYLSWLNIVKIHDKKSDMNQLAIIQRLTGDWKKGENIEQHKQAQKWRVIYVGRDKQVSGEIFSYPERGEHLLGVKLVQLSSQSDSFIGYKCKRQIQHT